VGLGFRVESLGCRIQGPKKTSNGSGSPCSQVMSGAPPTVSGLGFRPWDLWFRPRGLEFWVRPQKALRGLSQGSFLEK